MSLKTFKAGEIGELTFDHLNEMAELLTRLAPILPTLEAIARVPRLKTPHVVIFPAKIVDYRALSLNGNDQPNRWEYAWEQVRFDFPTKNWVTEQFTFTPAGGPSAPPTSVITPNTQQPTKPGPVTDAVRTSTVQENIFGAFALNGYESPNNGIGIESGIDTDGPAYPDGFEVQPIPKGSIVPMYAMGGMADIDPSAPNGSSLVQRFFFCVPNQHDGDCGAAP